MIGMFLGTIVLLLPVRWILAGLQRLGWEQRAQNIVLLMVILTYIVLSWFVTRALHRRMFATANRAVRIGIPAVATVLAVATFWQWSNPSGIFASLAGGTSSHMSMGAGAVWEFGKYPDTETLRRLKRENITAVISLEHPGDLRVAGPSVGVLLEDRDVVDEFAWGERRIQPGTTSDAPLAVRRLAGSRLADPGLPDQPHARARPPLFGDQEPAPV